jgi:hypothetical protein
LEYLEAVRGMAKKAKSEHPLSKADRSEIMSEFKTNNDLLGG